MEEEEEEDLMGKQSEEAAEVPEGEDEEEDEEEGEEVGAEAVGSVATVS